MKELTTPQLKERIDAATFRLNKAAKDRNYMQLEKDMVNRFYEITKTETKQIDAELVNTDRRMEMLERDHRVHIKVHEQKVQHLEYEHKHNRRLVQSDGEMAIQRGDEMHVDEGAYMHREKQDLKRDFRDQQLANEDSVEMMSQNFEKNLIKLREHFEENHKKLEMQYDDQVEHLKVDLELRRKVEIHEIEERKNRHINELLVNHQQAFDEIKAYYNEITHDKLQLIRSLKDEIQTMREREKKNKKTIGKLTQENKDLGGNLVEKLDEQRDLEFKLRSFAKDKMALKNLRSHQKKVEERITEAKSEYRSNEERYRKVEKERDDLQRRFQKAVQDIQRRAELAKNAVLEKKLEELTLHHDDKQAQLAEVLTAAKLDPSVVSNVTNKLEQVLNAKNREIKDLQYHVHQCTKAYNDTIRVYETRLPSFGVPGEVGFDIIKTDTSKMPARLVTKISG